MFEELNKRCPYLFLVEIHRLDFTGLPKNFPKEATHLDFSECKNFQDFGEVDLLKVEKLNISGCKVQSADNVLI